MKNVEIIKNFFGEDAQFEHVGIAVKSIRNEFQDMMITEDPLHKVNVAFIYIHDIKVELVEPISESSPVSNVLQKGQSLYHLSFTVPDINKALKTARENGFHCIANTLPGKAYDDTSVTWVFSRVYGLVELIERS
jgi:hypothetical protein